MKNPFSTRSEMGIRKRILFLLLVVFVPLLLLQVFTFYRWYLDSKESEMQANLELARTVAKTFDAFISDVLHTQLAIGLAAVASPPPSDASLRKILQAAEALNSMLRSFSWVSPDGFFLMSTNPAMENQKAKRQELLPRILAGEEYAVSGIYTSPVTGERAFSIARGIRDSAGNLLGLVNCVCLSDKLDPVLAVERTKNAGISLIDSKGIHVYRYPASKYTPEQSNWLKLYPIIGEALKGREVVSAFESKLTGMKRLVSFVPIPSIGWVASCSRAEEEVVESMFETLLPQAMLILILALAAFGAAVILSRPISTSIRRLQDHAAALGKGEVQRLEMVSAPYEVMNLAATFNTMADKVRLREEALRESEERFRVVQELSPDGFLIFRPLRDGAGVVTDFLWIYENDAAARMNDTTPKEVCGKRVSEVLPHHDRSPFAKAYKEVAETGEVRVVEEAFYDKDTFRQLRWFRVVAVPTVGGDVAILVQNVTERKRAEEELRESDERLKLTLQSSAVGTFEIDLITGVGRWNAVEYELLGLRPGDAPADPETFFRYVHPQDVAELRARWEEGTRTGRFAAEFRVIRADGQERWLAGKGQFAFAETAESASDGGKRSPLRFLGVNFDITERKRAEEALRKAHDELDLRVRERTAELERKNQELQEFAFVASHDLNEPLRKIQTFGTLLRQKCADRLEESEREYISRMAAAAQRMQELLAALLNYSRIETKSEPFRPTPLGEVVRDAISDLELLIRTAGVQVRIGSLPTVSGDPNQLRQLIQNLLGNAIKYRRSGIPTMIRISGARTNSDCRILVEDNGIGFDEKYLDKIFQPFQRLHGRSEYPGLGIGLAICRKIVERHSGTITAKSSLGKGSTFIVTLPLSKEDVGKN